MHSADSGVKVFHFDEDIDRHLILGGDYHLLSIVHEDRVGNEGTASYGFATSTSALGTKDRGKGKPAGTLCLQSFLESCPWPPNPTVEPTRIASAVFCTTYFTRLNAPCNAFPDACGSLFIR